MRKYWVIAVLAALAVITAAAPAGLAQDAAPAPVKLTLDGTNYCLLCELSEADAAEGNSAYAMLNALKVSDAVDSEGNFLDELEGKTLHYLPTKAAEPLLVGEQYRGVFLTIVAEYYKEAASIKVLGFKASDSGWDDIQVEGPSNQQEL